MQASPTYSSQGLIQVLSFIMTQNILFVCLFMATLGLGCCAWAFSSCGERGLLFVVVHGFLIAVSSLVEEPSL